MNAIQQIDPASRAASRRDGTVLVFDLDDTLYPECDYVRSGFRAVDLWLRDQLSATGFAEVAIAHFAAGRRGNIFDLALQELGLKPDKELVARLVTVYREHRPTLSLHPDAAWALNYYRPVASIGILTDGYLVTQRKKVAALSLENRVDSVIYSDAYGRENWKPSTVPYCKLIESLGCEHARCVYVADNPEKDFVGPRKLGWRSIQIIRPEGEYCRRKAPESFHAEQTIGSLIELRDLLSV